MAKPYYTYFDNPFLHLRMDRPAFKAQALHSLRTVREADPGAPFAPLLAALETAIDEFDENLTDSGQSTAGNTDAFHKARKEWLAFVDDTMKDYVTPKLRKLPVYADFKKFRNAKLARLNQPALLTKSLPLLQLYAAHQAALYPTLVQDAQALYDALAAADETRDTQDAAIDDARLDLADDRTAIARAQHRLKAQLELTFDDADKVYSFFDFSAARGNKKVSKDSEAAPDSPAA